MESSTPLTLPRGFVDTTATDGRRLRIYYIRKTPVLPVEDIRPTTIDATPVATTPPSPRRLSEARAKLLRAAEIEVLRDFAAAYSNIPGESAI
ncbi:hypothetical protein E4U27_004307 [Claviceps purpurea]|nr:hypothetical protein E4U27_004307 [Claviceps purpurea]